MVPNRIVFSAHLTNYAEDGLPTEQHAAYYGARAAGGAGLIITEEHSTHPTDWPYEKLIHGFHPEVVPGYRRITEAVHRHGTPVFAQINHNGGQASSMFSRLPVWAPSAVADPLFREVPKEVDQHEIAEIVTGYATVAEHCRAGGFDGIELQCSHSSIVRGFLSPAINHRTDALRRLAREPGPPAGRDRRGRAPGHRARHGPRRAAVRRRADRRRRHRRRGGRGGPHGRGPGHGRLRQHLHRCGHRLALHDRGVDARAARATRCSSPRPSRQAVDLPVVGVGRFKDPLQADRALDEGHCDLVGVVRGQIADADFAAKARAGRTDDIRLCLSCNQECVGRMGLNRWLGCIENPRTGREAERQARPDRRGERPCPAAGRVWSAPGPRGCRRPSAAERGHRVTVLERRPTPAGRCAWPRRCPAGRSWATWCATRCRVRGGWASRCYGSRPTPPACWPRRPTSWWWPPARPRPGRGGRRVTRPGSSTWSTSSTGASLRRGGWSCSTSWGSTRRPRWRSCWPTGAARSR